VQLIQHQGKSANAQRQNGPHVHSAFFSPDQKWLWVQDLGTDEVVAYPYDAQNKTQPLSEKGKRVYKAQAGSGPRHLAFHPRLPMAYVLEELTGTIAVLSTNLAQSGAVPLLQQSIAMVDAKDKGKAIGAADIHLSADGRFLYASNRGDFNELVQFAIQPNGQLAFVARYATQGIKPRNFTLSPDGKWLLVAHQNSHNIVVFRLVVFRRDTQTGLLENSGQILQVGAPVCLFFLP
ncbi:MAG: lactonase family protein, partial [Sphingobacteriia bacterium]